MYLFPNGKRYVGATSKSLAARQGVGFKRYKNCKAVWSAIQEFGYENIKQYIVFEGEIEDDKAAKIERLTIRFFDTTNPEKGYNTYQGGEGVKKTLTPERREQLRKQMYEISQKNFNRIASEETRRKQSLAKLGKKHGPMSEETKKKISLANSRENMSEETHVRRSQSKKKKVKVTNPETKETMVFNSIEDTAEYFNVRSSAVSRWISGDRNPSNKMIFQFYSPTTTE